MKYNREFEVVQTVRAVSFKLCLSHQLHRENMKIQAAYAGNWNVVGWESLALYEKKPDSQLQIR